MKLTHSIKLAALSLIISTGIVTTTYADESSTTATIFKPSTIKWTKGPASLPKGAEMAVLEGDPTAAGPFTLRIKMPAHYEIAPHSHPGIEHVTVISGNFFLGMGDKFDKKHATSMTTGSFAYMAPGTHHFGYVSKETIIQLNGMGPWGIDYLNSADDPRNKQ